MTTALATIRPDEMASLPTSLTRLISFETSSITASDGQFEGAAVSRVVVDPAASEEDIRAALRVLAEQCRPCGGAYAAQQLARLRALTKMRADQDGKLLAMAYTDLLAEFPADVVRNACMEWAKGNTFFPAWADLQRICDRLCSARLALRRALADMLKPKPVALYLGKPKPETPEVKLRTIRDGYLRVGNPHKAARRERELAALENREPEEWARNIVEERPAGPLEREPFVPGDDAKTQRLRALAVKFRAEEEAKRGGVKFEAV